MVGIQNDDLLVTIRRSGAELSRIYNKQADVEYLWDADPEHWAKHAPVLFPIVGTLRDDTYYFENKAYNLPRHGFARNMEFKPVYEQEASAGFELSSDPETLRDYPFGFVFRIHYLLEGNKLVNRYEVVNTGKEDMFFSVGGHPAFRVPLRKGLNYDDYYLEFDLPETLPRWNLSNGLVKTHPQPFLDAERKIPLDHELFREDAIILKHPLSKCISLKSRADRHGLTMRIDEFPYLGIWAPPEAPFVCIEPWQGIADSLYHNQQLTDKEGMVKLAAGSTWTRSWDITLW